MKEQQQENLGNQHFKKREEMAREIFLKTFYVGDIDNPELLNATAIVCFEIAEMFFDTSERRRG